MLTRTTRLSSHRALAAVHFRKLTESHTSLLPLTSGVLSLDRVTWGDRWFDMATTPERTIYLLKSGSKVMAYLSITLDKNDCLWIDELAADN